MAMWSIYTICLRFRPPGMHVLSFLFVITCIGDLAVLPFYALETMLGQPMHWTPAAALALLAVALFSSVLAYIFWNRGVEQVGANVAGLFVHLMPVFGVVLAWFVLDERLRAVSRRRHRAHPVRHLHHEPIRSRGRPRRNGLSAAARRRITNVSKSE